MLTTTIRQDRSVASYASGAMHYWGMPRMTLSCFSVRSTSLAELTRRARKGAIPEGLLLALDPGDTSGWALFQAAELIDCGQFRAQSLASFAEFIRRIHPDMLVVENYRIYADKLERHVGSEVPTIRYIGAIELTADLLAIPLYYQWAHQAKGFASDSRLRTMGLYQPNRRHANDAIRHATYWYLFGAKAKPHSGPYRTH